MVLGVKLGMFVVVGVDFGVSTGVDVEIKPPVWSGVVSAEGVSKKAASAVPSPVSRAYSTSDSRYERQH